MHCIDEFKNCEAFSEKPYICSMWGSRMKFLRFKLVSDFELSRFDQIIVRNSSSWIIHFDLKSIKKLMCVCNLIALARLCESKQRQNPVSRQRRSNVSTTNVECFGSTTERGNSWFELRKTLSYIRPKWKSTRVLRTQSIVEESKRVFWAALSTLSE